MQVSKDSSAACGYRVRTSPLREEPSWRWDCRMAPDNHIELQLVESSAADCAPAAPTAAAMLE